MYTVRLLRQTNIEVNYVKTKVKVFASTEIQAKQPDSVYIFS